MVYVSLCNHAQPTETFGYSPQQNDLLMLTKITFYPQYRWGTMKYRNDVKARALAVISIMLALTVTACSDDDKTPEKTHSEKIIGIWERIGIGTVFAVTDQSTTIYDFTRATCLKSGEIPGRFGFSKEKIDKDITFSNNSSEFLYQPTGGCRICYSPPSSQCNPRCLWNPSGSRHSTGYIWPFLAYV